MSSVVSRRIVAAFAAVAALVAGGGWTASQAQSGPADAGYQSFDAGDGNTVMAPADHAAYFRGARSGRASQITNEVTAKLAKSGAVPTRPAYAMPSTRYRRAVDQSSTRGPNNSGGAPSK